MSLGVTKNATLSDSANSTRPLAPPNSRRARTTRIRRCCLRRRIGSLGRVPGDLDARGALRGRSRLQLRPACPGGTDEAADLLELGRAPTRTAPALHQERDQHQCGKAVRRPDVGCIAAHGEELSQEYSPSLCWSWRIAAGGIHSM